MGRKADPNKKLPKKPAQSLKSKKPNPKQKPQKPSKAQKPPKHTKQPKKLKKISKKSSKKQPKKPQLSNKPRRGFKQCQGCPELINIHRRVCTQCGTVNSMKKALYTIKDVMAGKSPKSLQVLLESNMTNQPQNSQVRVEKAEKKTAKHKNKEPWSILKVKYPLKCSRFSPDCTQLAVVEQLTMNGVDLKENDIITLKAFNLEGCHKLGHKYTGTSYLHILKQPFDKFLHRHLIQKNIIQIEWISNSTIAVLCGDGQVTLIEFTEDGIENIAYIIGYTITVIQIVRLTSIFLLCGDQFGNIYAYQYSPPNLNLTRRFLRAHNAYLTCLRSCPINTPQSVLFASGSYDGYVKLWTLHDLDCVFQSEVTTRKVVNLEWDSGGKFLTILVDDQNQGFLMVCFYSASKLDNRLALLPVSETRYIKELTNYTFISRNSGLQAMALASCDGHIATCCLENLRKLAVKKKKRKSSEIVSSSAIVAQEGLEVLEAVPAVGEPAGLQPPVITDLHFGGTLEPLIAATTNRGELLLYRPQLRDGA